MIPTKKIYVVRVDDHYLESEKYSYTLCKCRAEAVRFDTIVGATSKVLTIHERFPGRFTVKIEEIR